MEKKRVKALLLAATMVIGTLGGSYTVSAGENGDVVKIKIHSFIMEESGTAEVLEKLNEYTKEKIGVEVEYVTHGGAFADKIQTIIASGEEYDACFTSNWLNPYNTNVAKGAFMDIKEMLPEVAPKLYEALPEYMWEAATINGGLYAIPNQQIVARQIGAQMPKEYVDAAGVNVNDLTSYTALMDYAQYAFDNFGAKVGGTDMSQAADYCGYENISDYMSVGAVKMRDETATVVNFYETEEWIHMLEELAALAEKGLLDGQSTYDAAYHANQRMAKKESACFGGTYKPGVEAEASAGCGYDVVYSRSDVTPYITTGSVVATMYGISSTSKHPEETLKYFELLNTDPYVMNLLTYGIEGKNYEKISDNMVRMIPNSGYNNNAGASWALGNVFNTYVIEGQPEDVWEQTKELNDSAGTSVLLGFSFDPDPVKTELMNIARVVKEYESITGGELPIEKTNAEFVEKLKVAGSDTVIEEMQRQVDEFMATK